MYTYECIPIEMYGSGQLYNKPKKPESLSRNNQLSNNQLIIS